MLIYYAEMALFFVLSFKFADLSEQADVKIILLLMPYNCNTKFLAIIETHKSVLKTGQKLEI